uniref:Uncharacterized protein n=1 Tax=Arundo donax TaxID=35708 RepID=A0A0A9FBQ8_ARUDO
MISRSYQIPGLIQVPPNLVTNFFSDP